VFSRKNDPVSRKCVSIPNDNDPVLGFLSYFLLVTTCFLTEFNHTQ
jgi:hypothetical protein